MGHCGGHPAANGARRPVAGLHGALHAGGGWQGARRGEDRGGGAGARAGGGGGGGRTGDRRSHGGSRAADRRRAIGVVRKLRGGDGLIDSRMFVPTKAFLTKGVGRHKEKLTSFEMSLRDAHLANFNLVRVSSIFPPHCELMDREEGLSLLKPGQVVFAVIAECGDDGRWTTVVSAVCFCG